MKEDLSSFEGHRVEILKSFIEFLKEIELFVKDNLKPSMMTVICQISFRKGYCAQIADYNVKLDRYRSDLHLEYQVNKEEERAEDIRSMKTSLAALTSLIVASKGDELVRYSHDLT